MKKHIVLYLIVGFVIIYFIMISDICTDFFYRIGIYKMPVSGLTNIVTKRFESQDGVETNWYGDISIDDYYKYLQNKPEFKDISTLSLSAKDADCTFFISLGGDDVWKHFFLHKKRGGERINFIKPGVYEIVDWFDGKMFYYSSNIKVHEYQ